MFRAAADFQSYLTTLMEFRERLGLKVYAWCLMTNHVHLIVDPGEAGLHLSQLMKHLAARHTRRVNRILHRTGTAWEGRYKCSLIDTDTYLLACLRYVECNPVRAGIVDQPEKYLWSSYRMRMGFTNEDWLDYDPAYLALADSEAPRRQRYANFVMSREAHEDLSVLRAALQRNQVTGSDAFIDEAEQRLGRVISRRAPGRPSK